MLRMNQASTALDESSSHRGPRAVTRLEQARDRGSKQTHGAHVTRGVAAGGLETSLQVDENTVRPAVVRAARLWAHASGHTWTWVPCLM